MVTPYIQKPSKDNFVCSDYAFAAFLMCFGFKLMGLTGQKPRLDFVLQDHDTKLRESLTFRFDMEQDDEVSAGEYRRAQKQLQRLLRNYS